jgi:hypothetical protein
MAKKLVRNTDQVADILTTLIEAAKKQALAGVTNTGRKVTQKDFEILNRARRAKKKLDDPPQIVGSPNNV